VTRLRGVCGPLPFFFFSDELLEDFLSQRAATPTMAVELVQMSAGFFLSATPKLAQRALSEFNLTTEQRSAYPHHTEHSKREQKCIPLCLGSDEDF